MSGRPSASCQIPLKGCQRSCFHRSRLVPYASQTHTEPHKRPTQPLHAPVRPQQYPAQSTNYQPNSSYPPPPTPSAYDNSYPPQQYAQQQEVVPPSQPWTGPPTKGPADSLTGYAKALVAAGFVAGLGMGVYFDQEVTLTPSNISSTEIIDRIAPSADLCMAYGYSASVFDMRIYVSYNPFNVYVSQPVVKSGCVLRQANVAVLENENLVTGREVDKCKNNMNTFAFTGDLKDSPEVDCVYHSEEAENQFLTKTLPLKKPK